MAYKIVRYNLCNFHCSRFRLSKPLGQMLSVNLPHSTPFSNWLLMYVGRNNNFNTQGTPAPAPTRQTLLAGQMPTLDALRIKNPFAGR